MTSRSFLLSTALAVSVGAINTARADVIIDDPLHGFCNAVTCSDNGTDTTNLTNPPGFNGTHWGFWISPGPQGPATFEVIIAVPNTEPTPGSIAITGTIAGISQSATATILPGSWGSGQLDASNASAVIPGGASPTNSFGGGQSASDQTKPGATSFTLFAAGFASVTLPAAPGTAAQMDLSATGLTPGDLIYGFLHEPQAGDAWTATATSGMLLVDAGGSTPPPPPPSVPEPASIALLGVGLLGLGTVTWRRRS
jgi:hypothetical protein